jgi:hypothetical protein
LIRIPPGAWMFFSCDYCVLSGRGLYHGPSTHPEESYRLWCVVASIWRAWPALGRSVTGKGIGCVLHS